jgi:hypothetical protein
MADYLITISDQDALDAIDSIIATNGLGETQADIVAGMIVPQFVAIRGQQITNAAQAAAASDPAVLAFQQRQADKAALQKPLPPEPSPVMKVLS